MTSQNGKRALTALQASYRANEILLRRVVELDPAFRPSEALDVYLAQQLSFDLIQELEAELI